MIRHVALFRFVDDLESGAIDDVDRALAALPGSIDVLAAFRHGRDLDLTEGAWDYAVVADFATADDYHAYATHPRHVEVVTTTIRPILAEAARIQFDM